MPDFIKAGTDGTTAIITLNRPEVMNAWNTRMRQEILSAMAGFAGDSAIRALIFTGAGDRAFCAGQDLNEAKDLDPDSAVEWIEEWRTLYTAFRTFPKPVIAALNGVSAGSAFQACLMMDIRVAHPGVRLGQPEVKSGIASITGPWIMNAMFGLSRTTELALSGRLMMANEAANAGIVHHLVDQDQVMPTALRLAGEMGNLPGTAFGLTKRWLAEMTQPGFDAAFEAARRYHREAYESGEPQRETAGFVTKKKA
ncbi:MAG: enoyl-CoA hydratase/isomerase family protein [Rhodospirillales bacterium]